jgi:hypothetical protein
MTDARNPDSGPRKRYRSRETIAITLYGQIQHRRQFGNVIFDSGRLVTALVPEKEL